MGRDAFTDAERITLTTKHGQRIELSETGGVVVDGGQGTTITVDSRGVTISGPGRVELQASQVELTAGQVRVDAGMSQFSGVVQCDTLIASSVVASSYTPGAGNVW